MCKCKEYKCKRTSAQVQSSRIKSSNASDYFQGFWVRRRDPHLGHCAGEPQVLWCRGRGQEQEMDQEQWLEIDQGQEQKIDQSRSRR